MSQSLETLPARSATETSARDRDLVSASRELQAVLHEHRDETESERRIPASIVERVLDADLCRMALSADADGLETDPVAALEVFENLAWGEGAVAWVVWNNSLPCYLSRTLCAEVRRELLGPRRRMAIAATRVSGRAQAEEGGFRVSGRWSLVSGCELAEWIAVMATVTDAGEPRMAAPGIPDNRFFWVHRSDLGILDTWHASGLRGSGSHDVVVEDLLVPEERSCSWFGPSRVDSAFGRLPFFSVLTAGCTSICLGLASAALDALREVIETKVQTNPLPELKLRPEVLSLVARAEQELGAVRRELHAAVGAVRDENRAGEVGLETRARVWTAAILGAERCRELAREIGDAAGTPALYQSSPIERAQRDLNAALQHVVFDHSMLAEAGRVLLGIPIDNPMF